ncbi:ABC transporter permease [Nocardioides sp. LML1-1-1.1]|uniref:ABC transporter permease n=1 Tax=Nocardioides sp. LML1-1-1.1 TaxID=3135248 RepID=UPI00342574DC
MEPEKAAGGDVASKSPMRLAMGRLRRDKLSMISLFVVLLVVLAAIAAPFLVKWGVLDPYTLHNSGKDNLLDEFTLPKGSWGGISKEHPLGVEPQAGRDAMSRFWYGITFSLLIALTASLMAVALGTVLGIIAGFSRGWVDALIGRVIDLTLSFPQTLMLLALAAIGLQFIKQVTPLEGSAAEAGYAVAVLAVFGWPQTARVVRGQVLSIREREFVDAAVLLGASRRRIYFREILPNLWAPLLVLFTLSMPAYVSAEAALSYLGVSVKPPTPTLGNVLRDSLQYATADPVYFFVPAILIAVIVISFNLLGDGLRDALDPKGNR